MCNSDGSVHEPVAALDQQQLRVTGVEIHREAAALAEKNIRHNNLQERCNILCGDLRNYRQILKAGAYDVVVSNPPYFPVERGEVSPDRDRAVARGELMCTLDDICAAAGWLCRWDGRFALVHRPDRLPEVFDSMQKAGIEPKRLRLVSHFASSVPSLVLVEGRRGGKPGLTMEPILVSLQQRMWIILLPRGYTGMTIAFMKNVYITVSAGRILPRNCGLDRILPTGRLCPP